MHNKRNKKHSWIYDAQNKMFVSVKWIDGKKVITKTSERELINKATDIILEDDLLDDYFNRCVVLTSSSI